MRHFILLAKVIWFPKRFGGDGAAAVDSKMGFPGTHQTIPERLPRELSPNETLLHNSGRAGSERRPRPVSTGHSYRVLETEAWIKQAQKKTA